MGRKGIGRKDSKVFLIASIVIFAAAEIIAEFADLWLMKNPSLGNLLTYNRWFSTVPNALSVGASVSLMFGLVYHSRLTIISTIFVGAALLSLSFILGYSSLFIFSIEYYPGYSISLISGPVANLFGIGLGAVIAAIFGSVFRDNLIQK